jgi:hypothetical protein
MINISINMQGSNFPDNFFYLNVDEKDLYHVVLFSLHLESFLENSKIVPYFLKHQLNTFGMLEEEIFDVVEVKNTETNKYILIDFRDFPNLSIHNLQTDDNCLAVYASMYHNGFNYFTDYNFLDSYYPFFFFDQQPNLIKDLKETIKIIRKNKKNLLPKMVFYGSVGDEPGSSYLDGYADPDNPRPMRYVLRKIKEKRPDLIDIFDWSTTNVDKLQWLVNASTYMCVLTIPGHPWTYRENECGYLGIATIANTYTVPQAYPYIGNVHYIDANTTGKTILDTEFDVDKAADLIIERFLQVKDDYDFINAIETNAQERYENYSSTKPAAKYISEEVKRLLL